MTTAASPAIFNPLWDYTSDGDYMAPVKEPNKATITTITAALTPSTSHIPKELVHLIEEYLRPRIIETIFPSKSTLSTKQIEILEGDAGPIHSDYVGTKGKRRLIALPHPSLTLNEVAAMFPHYIWPAVKTDHGNTRIPAGYMLLLLVPLPNSTRKDTDAERAALMPKGFEEPPIALVGYAIGTIEKLTGKQMFSSVGIFCKEQTQIWKLVVYGSRARGGFDVQHGFNSVCGVGVYCGSSS